MATSFCGRNGHPPIVDLLLQETALSRRASQPLPLQRQALDLLPLPTRPLSLGGRLCQSRQFSPAPILLPRQSDERQAREAFPSALPPRASSPLRALSFAPLVSA